jgi:DNA mismatch repair protein MutL
MPRIARLPEDLANKIAAGEVVERPASVVKELVENALDAGARSVQVEIQGGGRSMIRVRDDGTGMDAQDARTALERHATSKLRAFADLLALETNGFRGEALPAIASVSHLVLRTREESSAAGTEVEVKDGRLLGVREVGHPRGTSVEVRDLFASVPARRKFLRAESTELSHCAEALTLAALTRPDVAFTLSSRGRALVEAPAAESLFARLFQLFGTGMADRLLPVQAEAEGVRVLGFVSRPERKRSGRPSLRLFVNGRPVRDRGLSRAVAEGYRAAAADTAFEAFVFVETPRPLVDVNVHPAKAEVRFAEPRGVWAAVEAAVRRALSQGARAETGPARAGAERAVAAWLGGARETSAPPARLWDGAAPVGEARTPYADGGGAEPAVGASREPMASAEPLPRVLGQHRHTYIVASDGEELILFDQHTAHERVRFEHLGERWSRRALESQYLLTPAVATLPPALAPVLEEYGEALAGLGYEVESFGGKSLVVRRVPADLPAGDPGRELVSILADLAARAEEGFEGAGREERVVATVACHSSVRAGQPLGRETMEAIVRGLGRTAHPTLCPHGRPTMARVPRAELARWFGRTGWRRQ